MRRLLTCHERASPCSVGAIMPHTEIAAQPKRSSKRTSKPTKAQLKERAKRKKGRAAGRKRRAAERLRVFEQMRNMPDDAVMTVGEWTSLNSLSARAARRILHGDNGPAVVQLTPQRVGITVKANREWQE